MNICFRLWVTTEAVTPVVPGHVPHNGNRQGPIVKALILLNSYWSTLVFIFLNDQTFGIKSEVRGNLVSIF